MKTKLIYVVSAMILLTNVSCEDLLTEKPDSYYKKEDYFANASNARMAVTGVFDALAKLNHYGQFEMAMPSSDDTYYIQGTGTDNTRRDISHYTIRVENQWVNDIWTYKYLGIDRANFAIAGIEGMEGYESNTQLKGMVAEVRFVRALLAYDLIKYWGDVPFKTEYTASFNDAYQPRKNREEIYDVIVQDLNFAKQNLEWATAGSSPERPTQGAARALLMRVLMQRAGYSLRMDGTLQRPADSKRTEYFNAVLQEWEAFKSGGSYHSFYSTGYLNLFKSFSAGELNSKESLFEVAFFNASGMNEDSGTWGTYNGPLVDAPVIKSTETGGFMGRANAFFRVLPAWKDFFEATDARRDVMVCTYKYTWNAAQYKHVKTEQAIGNNWYPGKWRREWMPIGYKEPNNTDINFCYIRYADVVLMAAEAYNETNQTATAWTLLNSVRTRAGATAITGTNYASFYKAPKVYDLPYITDGDDAGRFRTALYWERGFELAFEGQRKYDLVRWGILKESLEYFGNKQTITAVKNNFIAGKNFTKGKDELFPIPLDEMQVNKKLEGKNNPGY